MRTTVTLPVSPTSAAMLTVVRWESGTSAPAGTSALDGAVLAGTRASLGPAHLCGRGHLGHGGHGTDEQQPRERRRTEHLRGVERAATQRSHERPDAAPTACEARAPSRAGGAPSTAKPARTPRSSAMRS